MREYTALYTRVWACSKWYRHTINRYTCHDVFRHIYWSCTWVETVSWTWRHTTCSWALWTWTRRWSTRSSTPRSTPWSRERGEPCLAWRQLPSSRRRQPRTALVVQRQQLETDKIQSSCGIMSDRDHAAMLVNFVNVRHESWLWTCWRRHMARQRDAKTVNLTEKCST